MLQLLDARPVKVGSKPLHGLLVLSVFLAATSCQPGDPGESTARSPASIPADSPGAPPREAPPAEEPAASPDATGPTSPEPVGESAEGAVSTGSRDEDDEGDGHEHGEAREPDGEGDDPPIHSPGMLPPGVKVSVEARELVIPCLFVEPTQALEVFACHWEGPIHESVVAFRASGEDIYLGLMELGLMGPEFWNATSRTVGGKPDVRYTLGDRAVVFLRWERDGETHEVAAEKLLREPSTEYVPFVRGFTFGLGEVLMGDPPRRRIPPRVEITIGGATRGEKAVDSVLFHVNDLRELTPWMPPLEINSKILPEIRQLVRDAVTCQLVIRVVDGEEELLKLARLQESDSGRRELISTLMPVAADIDRLKAAYRADARSLLDLVARGERAEEGSEAAGEINASIEKLIGGARMELAVLSIWKRYLELFLAQEKFRLGRLPADPEGRLGQAAMAKAHYERLAHEPELVAIESEIVRRQSATGEAGEADRLLLEAYELDHDALRHAANLPLADFDRRELEQKIEELDPVQDRYHITMTRERIDEIAAAHRYLAARRDELASRARENRARAGGKWAEIRDEVLARRARATLALELSEREKERVEILSDIRWANNFLDDEQLPADRRQKHEAELKDLLVRRKTVEAKITELSAELEGK